MNTIRFSETKFFHVPTTRFFTQIIMDSDQGHINTDGMIVAHFDSAEKCKEAFELIYQALNEEPSND